MTDSATVGRDLLRSGFAGRVVAASDRDYAAERATILWNGATERCPAVIARCGSSADVAAAVRFARAHDLEISVRGGGHSFAGFAACQDGIMVDLGPMRSVAVDAQARTATVGGGATWADVDAATQQHALACPGGFVSHTGVGGLAVGGGIGWLNKKAGLVSDSRLAAEIVPADGSVLRASADEHPDLFWALRGGGGNFGVVTSFVFRLIPVGPTVQLGLLFYGLDQGAEALQAARDLVPRLSQDVAPFLGALNAPPAPFVPEAYHLQPGYALVLAGFGSEAEHAEAVAAMRAAVAPQFEFVTPIPYVALQQLFDDAFPWGSWGYEKAVSLDDLTDAAIDVICRHVPHKTSPLSGVVIQVLGGSYAAVADDSSAFGGRRTTRYAASIAAVTPDPQLYEADRAWVKAFWSDLVVHAPDEGSYVNYMTDIEDSRIRAAYGADKYRRLAALKARFDPHNVFHLNPNIRPAP